MMAQFIAVGPFDLVVFGGTGDLAMRKLLPGLYHRDSDGQLGTLAAFPAPTIDNVTNLTFPASTATAGNIMKDRKSVV